MGSRRARQYYCRCGTHLAKDNTERQCARCQRATRDKLIAPPEVPAEFWQTQQFRDAFSTQHLGRVARVYRMHPYHHAVYGPSGISQTLLGQWLGLRQPQVSRIETRRPVRDLDTLVYWAQVLRIPVELLWFDMPGNQRQVQEANRRALDAGDEMSRHAADDVIQLWVKTALRETADTVDPATHSSSKEGALTWLLTVSSDSAQRTNGSHSVSMAHIEALSAMQCSLIGLNDEHGGGAVLPMAVAYLKSEVAPLLQGRYTERIGNVCLRLLPSWRWLLA